MDLNKRNYETRMPPEALDYLILMGVTDKNIITSPQELDVLNLIEETNKTRLISRYNQMYNFNKPSICTKVRNFLKR